MMFFILDEIMGALHVCLHLGAGMDMGMGMSNELWVRILWDHVRID